jgi:hypothetical protein
MVSGFATVRGTFLVSFVFRSSPATRSRASSPRPLLFRARREQVTKRASAVSSTLEARCVPRPSHGLSALLSKSGHASGAATPSLEPRERLAPVRDDQRIAMTAATSFGGGDRRSHRQGSIRIEVIGPSVHAPSSHELATCTALSIAPERSNLDTLVVVG